MPGTASRIMQAEPPKPYWVHNLEVALLSAIITLALLTLVAATTIPPL